MKFDYPLDKKGNQGYNNEEEHTVKDNYFGCLFLLLTII